MQDATIKIGLAVAALVVTWPARNGIRRLFVKAADRDEQDVVQAEMERSRFAKEKRVRVVPARPKPEWWKRVVKKWNAAGRLGNQKLQRSE